jgi:Retrotransposon gag protein
MSENQTPSENAEENGTNWTTDSNREAEQITETITDEVRGNEEPSMFEEAARNRLAEMEEENADLRQTYAELHETVLNLQQGIQLGLQKESVVRDEPGSPEDLSRERRAEKKRMAHIEAIKNSIPIFLGKSLDPGATIEFIEKAKLYISLSGLPEQEKCQYICTRFQENTLHWYREQAIRSPRIQKSWKSLESAIRERFLPIDFEFSQLQRLLALRQGSKPIQEHVEEFAKVMSITYGLSEVAKVCIFVNGLNSNIAKSVRSVLENLSSLDRAITSAVRIGKGEDTETPKEENKALLSQGVNSNTRVFCWRCLQPGHFARGCVKRPIGANKFRGNQRGTMKRNYNRSQRSGKRYEE